MVHAGGVEGVGRGQALTALALSAVIAVKQFLARDDLADLAFGGSGRLGATAGIEVVGRPACLGP